MAACGAHGGGRRAVALRVARSTAQLWREEMSPTCRVGRVKLLDAHTHREWSGYRLPVFHLQFLIGDGLIIDVEISLFVVKSNNDDGGLTVACLAKIHSQPFYFYGDTVVG